MRLLRRRGGTQVIRVVELAENSRALIADSFDHRVLDHALLADEVVAVLVQRQTRVSHVIVVVRSASQRSSRDSQQHALQRFHRLRERTEIQR